MAFFVVGLVVGTVLGALVMSLFAASAYQRGVEDAIEFAARADHTHAPEERLTG